MSEFQPNIAIANNLESKKIPGPGFKMVFEIIIPILLTPILLFLMLPCGDGSNFFTFDQSTYCGTGPNLFTFGIFIIILSYLVYPLILIFEIFMRLNRYLTDDISQHRNYNFAFKLSFIIRVTGVLISVFYGIALLFLLKIV